MTETKQTDFDGILIGKTVALLITGSIAAYKGAEIARELVKRGADVIPVLSRGGRQFITPLTLQTLTGNTVLTDLFDLDSERDIGHIAVADAADVVLVAPATADVIAKTAAGIADDITTAILLATNAPVIFAPAMNVQMWENEATRRNISTLRERGATVAVPGEGLLACGWFGAGRLADVNEIISITAEALAAAPPRKRRSESKAKATVKDLSGVDFIVTAGPTREPLDPVRFISNRSSGKMGFALAERARARGARVVLIAGPTALYPPPGVEFEQVQTAREMHDAVSAALSSSAAVSSDKQVAVIMAAAVTDHRPATESKTKLHPDKNSGYEIQMIPNPDILAELSSQRREMEQIGSGFGVRIIGFSVDTAEGDQLLGVARGKLERRQIDAIVANGLAGFENDSNHVWFLRKTGEAVEIPLASKSAVADEIIDHVLKLW